MMIEEFEKLTGIYPTNNLYKCIEDAYISFEGDKVAFCKAYQKNKNGLAEKIRNEVNKKMNESNKTALRTEQKLRQEILRLGALLDKELEWVIYESPDNVKQADYERLAKDAKNGLAAHYMTDEEAIDWVCDEFDFNPAKITILHDIDEYEINRHHQLRATGRKIDRRPVYCATDYYYIRFNTSRFYYEAWNGQLLKY